VDKCLAFPADLASAVLDSSACRAHLWARPPALSETAIDRAGQTSLAGIAMQKRRKVEATKLLQEAKKLDKQQMLTDQIKMMQQQLKKI